MVFSLYSVLQLEIFPVYVQSSLQGTLPLDAKNQNISSSIRLKFVHENRILYISKLLFFDIQSKASSDESATPIHVFN